MTQNPYISASEVFQNMLDKGYSTTLASVQSTMSRFRKSKQINSNSKQINSDINSSLPIYTGGLKVEKVNNENYVERDKTIQERYKSLEVLTEQVCKGIFPSLIVSGPPGLGKSYTIKKVINALNKDKVSYISGTIRGPGLYIQLWEQKDNGVLILDDSDDIFKDETALNLLKCVLDSTKKRIVSYHKLANFLVQHDIPTSFEFRGSIIFCTNIDMELEMYKTNALVPHFKAIIDRSLYLHLAMRNQYDYFCRVKQVINDGLFKELDLSDKDIVEIVKFIKKHLTDFHILSLRLVYYIGIMKKSHPKMWQQYIKATKMKSINL